jgi:predicted nuclease of predicted toxin-antitoxin system
VKLLLDAHISGTVASRLRKLGYDVIAVTADPALRSLRDADVFEIAQREGRAIVTYDRDDFEALIRAYARAGRPHQVSSSFPRSASLAGSSPA